MPVAIDAPYVCQAPVATDGEASAVANCACACSASMRPRSGPASKASLSRAIRGTVRYRPVKLDRYGRTIAVVYAGSINLSCYQIRAGQAAYVGNWDDGRIVAQECR